MPPAARLTDMHTCPMVTGIVPHVGGPILPPCCPTVLIGFQPAARVTDMCTCVGPPDAIAKGSATVLIGHLMAARLGDLTVHGGVITIGFPTVIIGDVGMGTPVYTTKPTLAQILSDPTVDALLKKAWDESNPDAPEVKRGDPGSLKQEQGGWIVWNKNTGQLEVVRVPPGTRDGLGTIVGTRPADNSDQEVVGWFHTHPNTASEGYGHEPSPGDTGYQNGEAKVPGIIETHDGRKTIPYP